MAKLEKTLTGDFRTILKRIEDGVLNSSLSATLEESCDWTATNARCSVRVFERYSYFGKNRVSMSLTLFQTGNVIKLCAITSGGSQALFFKINTIGEESFLSTLERIL